jgi:hypothetical protein
MRGNKPNQLFEISSLKGTQLITFITPQLNVVLLIF